MQILTGKFCQMKKHIKFLCILLLVTGCTTGRTEKLISHITLLDRIDFAELEMDTTHLRDQLIHGSFNPVKLELLNNTDSTLYYWTNSCSWQSNWIPDHKSITWVVECPKNSPVLVKLMPHETQSHYGIVELTDSAILIGGEYKLGFVLVRKNEVNSDFDFLPILRGKINTNTDIFWSNPIIPRQKN